MHQHGICHTMMESTTILCGLPMTSTPVRQCQLLSSMANLHPQQSYLENLKAPGKIGRSNRSPRALATLMQLS